MQQREVRIVGFRGVGDNRHYTNEHDLIKAGHVGVSFDGGNTIFGFHPTPAAMAAFPTHDAAIAHLRARQALVGGVYDDTAIFLRAHELAHGGARTAVWQRAIGLQPEQWEGVERAVQEALAATSAGTYDRRYCWPVKDRHPMPEGVDNCATWPRVLGLELPEPTGILSVYIEALRDQGQRWP